MTRCARPIILLWCTAVGRGVGATRQSLECEVRCDAGVQVRGIQGGLQRTGSAFVPPPLRRGRFSPWGTSLFVAQFGHLFTEKRPKCSKIRSNMHDGQTPFATQSGRAQNLFFLWPRVLQASCSLAYLFLRAHAVYARPTEPMAGGGGVRRWTRRIPNWLSHRTDGITRNLFGKTDTSITIDVLPWTMAILVV